MREVRAKTTGSPKSGQGHEFNSYIETSLLHPSAWIQYNWSKIARLVGDRAKRLSVRSWPFINSGGSARIRVPRCIACVAKSPRPLSRV
jgi:hypothetical protein